MVAVPPKAAPATWTNQRVTLYHGTLDIYVRSVIGGITSSRGRAHTDFGQGFYTTTVELQARAWAWQLSQRRPDTSAAVIRFDVDRDALAKLECLWFVRGSSNANDFWSLIFHCRNGRTAHARPPGSGWYDVVVGPVAMSWRQRLTINDADQVSFHSQGAARLLNRSNPRQII